MGLEERPPSGILQTAVVKVAGYARKRSVWSATFGPACCAIELLQADGPGTTRPAWHGAGICHPAPSRPKDRGGPVSQIFSREQ